MINPFVPAATAGSIFKYNNKGTIVNPEPIPKSPAKMPEMSPAIIKIKRTLLSSSVKEGLKILSRLLF